MALCALAVGMNWATSLNVANIFSAYVIEVPPLEWVFHSCEHAYNSTIEERRMYSECVESELDACNGALDGTIAAEDHRVKAATWHNGQVVQRAVDISTECARSYMTLRLAMEDWMARGGEIPISNASSICSAEEESEFRSTLLGTQNVLALQSEALDITTAYGDESTRTVRQLADYAVQRAEYDRNYIDAKSQALQSKITSLIPNVPTPLPNVQSLMDEVNLAAADLMACVSLDKDARLRDGSQCDPSAYLLVDHLYRDATYKVKVLTDTLVDYRDKMNQYKRNVMKAYEVSKRFYNGVNNSVTRWIIDTFFSGDWFHVSLSNITPVDVIFPDIDVIIDRLGEFPTPQEMWSQLEHTMDGFHEAVDQVLQKLVARINSLLVSFQRSISFKVRLGFLSMPDDYDPPVYQGTEGTVTSVEEALLYQNKSDMFVAKSKEALGMFSGVENEIETDIGPNDSIPSFNITQIKNRVTNVQLEFEDLQQPDIDFDLWFLQLAHLSNGFEYVDYAFRLYVSIKLILKYWFATSLAMPRVDLRSNKEIQNPLRMHPLRATLEFITSPMGGFLIFVTSGVWLVAILASLYLPLYHAYIDGCVNVGGNGTFVTKNIYSVAYNHAYQDGSTLLVEGMDMFDFKRGETCSKRYASSATMQNNIQSNFSAYTEFHDEVTDQMGLAKDCLNVDELDSLFQNACCGVGDFPACTFGQEPNFDCPMDNRGEPLEPAAPYKLPGKLIVQPSCSIAINDGIEWEIKDGVYKCDSLSTCNVTCPKPNKERLDQVSKECGCTVEWYFHTVWLENSLAFFLYLCMNVARVLFFKGLTRLLWKKIYPDNFTILASCDSKGALVTKVKGSSHEDIISALQVQSMSLESPYANDDTVMTEEASDFEANAEESMSRELLVKLKSSLRKFYIKGALFFVSSFVVNAAWIYLVVEMSQSLKPRVWM